MKRRSFFGGALAGAGVLACPAWVERAFAQAATDDELASLSDAYRRAQRSGRPLLVLVIPQEPDRRYDRAYAFGELLNHGGPQVMRDLALAELACATMGTLRTLVPQAGAGEPAMVLIEPSAVPAAVRRLDAALEQLPEPFIYDEGETWEARTAREERAIDARIAMLSRLVHDAIAPDGATIAYRASLAREHLSAADRARLDAALASGRVDAATARLAPAMIAAAGARHEAVLEQVGIERWRAHRIPGSRWAVGGGCGIHIEEEPEPADGSVRVMMACGMGHVPERSARFLHWFTGS